MSQTFRLTYRIGNDPFTKQMYVTSTDAKLSWMLEALEGVTVSKVETLVGEQGQAGGRTAERKVG